MVPGEILNTTREGDNPHDHYAVAVLEEETCCVVGHLPREISRECFFFLVWHSVFTLTFAVGIDFYNLRFTHLLGRPGSLFARFIGGSVHRIRILGASSGSFEKKEIIFPLLASISTRERSHTLCTCALIMRQKNG